MGSKVKTFVLFLRIMLTVCFLLMTIRGIQKLTSYEIGTRSYLEKIEKMPNPSISICPFTYSPKVDLITSGQNKSFDDIMALPSIIESVLVDIEIAKPYTLE